MSIKIYSIRAQQNITATTTIAPTEMPKMDPNIKLYVKELSDTQYSESDIQITDLNKTGEFWVESDVLGTLVYNGQSKAINTVNTKIKFADVSNGGLYKLNITFIPTDTTRYNNITKDTPNITMPYKVNVIESEYGTVQINNATIPTSGIAILPNNQIVINVTPVDDTNNDNGTAYSLKDILINNESKQSEIDTKNNKLTITVTTNTTIAVKYNKIVITALSYNDIDTLDTNANINVVLVAPGTQSGYILGYTTNNLSESISAGTIGWNYNGQIITSPTDIHNISFNTYNDIQLQATKLVYNTAIRNNFIFNLVKTSVSSTSLYTLKLLNGYYAFYDEGNGGINWSNVSYHNYTITDKSSFSDVNYVTPNTPLQNLIRLNDNDTIEQTPMYLNSGMRPRKLNIDDTFALKFATGTGAFSVWLAYKIEFEEVTELLEMEYNDAEAMD